MNKMTNLLNKIERRLGTNIINLPKNLSKENWVTVIEGDTIPTFSRYLPNAIKVLVNTKVTDATASSKVYSAEYVNALEARLTVLENALTIGKIGGN